MANTEKSKLKLLYLYYYFMLMSSDMSDEGCSMNELKGYLMDKTDNEFERKSIYADINRLNEFARSVGMVDPTDDWISLESRKYKRGEIKGELTYDEARLVVDAINATDFIDSGLCEKIKKMYPGYFKNGYKSVVPHDNKKAQKRSTQLLNLIRTAIEEKYVLGFKYGYLVAGGVRGATDKRVSPLALDFFNSHYYIIAVDNDAVDNGTARDEAIKRYRLDRMKELKLLGNRGYQGFENEKDKILDRYLKESIDAYAAHEIKQVQMKLESDDPMELLRAFTGFAEDMSIKIIADEIEKGKIIFIVEAAIAPPFFNKLFRMNLYQGVKLTISDDEVSELYRKYLNNALKTLNK